MKRSLLWPVGLSLLGLVLIVFSTIWITVIEPGYEKLPTDLDETWKIDTVVSLEGTGVEMDLSVERVQKAIDVQDGVLIIEETVTSKPLPLLDEVITRGVDRSSKKLVPGYGDSTISALWAYPIGVKKQTYAVWADTAGNAPDARFMGEEKIDGLKVYAFNTDEKDLPFDPDDMGVTSLIPSEIAGPYTLDWLLDEKVEPYTGIVVDAQSVKQFFGTNDDNVKTLVGTMVQKYSQETVAEKISDAKHYKTQLLWATRYGLWIGYGLGIVCLLAGAFLFLRSKGNSALLKAK